MATKAIEKERYSRFDTRLPAEQKLFFEKASVLGGYRNLTDFILSAVQEKARKIVEESEQTALSRRDAEIFFQAVTNSAAPNQALTQAAQEYNTALSE